MLAIMERGTNESVNWVKQRTADLLDRSKNIHQRRTLTVFGVERLLTALSSIWVDSFQSFFESPVDEPSMVRIVRIAFLQVKMQQVGVRLRKGSGLIFEYHT